jgi:hypothetical protein
MRRTGDKMKKKIIALLAGALMVLSASSAFAAFTYAANDLYLVAYDTGTQEELVINLGTLTTNGSGTGYFGLNSSGGTLSFNESLLGSSATTATTNVALFGYSIGANQNSVLASSDPGDSPQSAYGTQSSFISAVNSIVNTAHAATTTNTYVGSTTNGAGYNGKMNASGTGSFAGLNDFGASTNGFSTPETTLANLIGGYTFGVFSFKNQLLVTNGVLQFNVGLTDDAGVETIALTSANTAATPIPAAFYLLGSGLMGLVGLRRKFQG